ncbi:hypothetical protein JCM3765_000827 [Sporobolomyces pararoseus]
MTQKPSASPSGSSKLAAKASQPKKRPAASEIDDIFAKKSKPASTSTSAPAEGTSSASSSKNKKKKGKKSEEAVAPEAVKEEETIAQPKKVPETVVDTSKTIESYNPAAERNTKRVKDMTEEEKKAAEEERQFRDSRGTRKKTEDGLPIYDTSELKIGLGGDTELCPFDCECCF